MLYQMIDTLKIALIGDDSKNYSIRMALMHTFKGEEPIGRYFSYSRSSNAYFVNDKGEIDYALKTTLPKEKYVVMTYDEYKKAFPIDCFKYVIDISGGFKGYITKYIYNKHEGPYYLINTADGRNRVAKPDEVKATNEEIKQYLERQSRQLVIPYKKAKEWYNAGGVLKELALMVFSDNELSIE